ncbi:hypothetical protein LPYR103PRE_13060 [Segatella asaccharophila]
MKIIQSLWTNPLKISTPWCDVDYFFTTWILSCLRLHLYHANYVIEYPLIGPYRFLQALTHFSGKFRLTDLIRGRTEKENRMIQLRIKKMLLNQMLIISG